MKSKISEYLPITSDKKKTIWDQGIFVFDTNILLHLYRYSKATRNEVFKAFRVLKGRVWLPYQTVYEYIKNRNKAIYETRYNHDQAVKLIIDTIKLQLGTLRADKEDIDKLTNVVSDWMSSYSNTNIEVVNSENDTILKELLVIFDSKVGNPYSKEELTKISIEGAERYKQKVPPGYMDSEKSQNGNENNCYGDLIFWKQVIDYSKENQKDIILITDDQKDDWWEKYHGQTVGPRIELKKEFASITGHDLLMYRMEPFLERIENDMLTSINQNAKEEIKRYDIGDLGIGKREMDNFVEAIKSLSQPNSNVSSESQTMQASHQGNYGLESLFGITQPVLTKYPGILSSLQTIQGGLADSHKLDSMLGLALLGLNNNSRLASPLQIIQDGNQSSNALESLLGTSRVGLYSNSGLTSTLQTTQNSIPSETSNNPIINMEQNDHSQSSEINLTPKSDKKDSTQAERVEKKNGQERTKKFSRTKP